MTPVELLYLMFLYFATGAAWFWIDCAIRARLRLKVSGPEYAIACALGGFVAVLVMVLALIRAAASRPRYTNEALKAMGMELGDG